ncbi:hypothetical protein DFH08DRAFT_967220 [Mycena albidolilacea]|uniref:Uncharacterized protein n=1 Tax=Mycena albidolilacea TaxID=1033008 RepID=A0AAD6ZNB6_9AGAR|nr:hypothetical protein DFH08DRAFT_967220 [Mycena albidolilacea]
MLKATPLELLTLQQLSCTALLHTPPDPRPKPALLGRRAQEEHALAAGVWSEEAHMDQTQRLHFREWLPYNERDMAKFRMYCISAVATTDEEWFSARAITEGRAVRSPLAVVRTVPELLQEYKLRAEALPRIMQLYPNTKALQKRSAEFSEARKAVDLFNVAFFKDVIGPCEQIPYRKLLQTQAVRDVMEAFGRSS